MPGLDMVGDLGIRDGRIAALSETLPPCDSDFDARGYLVLPGGVDAHVHFTPMHTADFRLAWADDYASGTASALSGGVTTVGDMCCPLPGEDMASAILRVEKSASHLSIADYFLHPVLLSMQSSMEAAIERIVEVGCRSLKLFLHLGDFDRSADRYLDAMSIAGKHGLVVMAHCEDPNINRFCLNRFASQGLVNLSNLPQARPIESEVAAVQRAIAFASVAGVTLYVVHLSSEEALGLAWEAQRRGRAVHVETRPLYLAFTDEVYASPDAAMYVGDPPTRTHRDAAALWRGLRTGSISTYCTDHAPWTAEEKMAEPQDLRHVRGGVSELDTSLPYLFSEGVLKGRITLERFVEVVSLNAARIFGLFPRKGTLSPGSDADIVLWDPDLVQTVDNRELKSRGYNLLEGRELTGWPVHVFSRGELVVHDRRLVGSPGRGRRLVANV